MIFALFAVFVQTAKICTREIFRFLKTTKFNTREIFWKNRISSNLLHCDNQVILGSPRRGEKRIEYFNEDRVFLLIFSKLINYNSVLFLRFSNCAIIKTGVSEHIPNVIRFYLLFLRFFLRFSTACYFSPNFNIFDYFYIFGNIFTLVFPSIIASFFG